MRSDPLDVAIREIAQTRRLLENLLTASESFDYPKAKVVLAELRLKTRTLGRLQAELAAQRPTAPEGIIPFPCSTR